MLFSEGPDEYSIIHRALRSRQPSIRYPLCHEMLMNATNFYDLRSNAKSPQSFIPDTNSGVTSFLQENG